ncbi:hypothetical protein ABW19_dt0202734 [Dactylella cylindrospora]|nr:hypothetical protein ABW19_dt0202734 [Dactylella cylindrospora]
MRPIFQCIQLQQQAACCERQILLRNIRLRYSNHHWIQWQSPRSYASSSSPYSKSAKSGKPSSKPKYPPIKPDPYKDYLAANTNLANPRPTLNPYGKLRKPKEPPEVTRQKVYRKIGISLILFVGCLAATQVWIPRDIRTASNDSGISAEDRKKFEEAEKSGGVVIREATSIGDVVETVPSGTSSVGPLPKQIFLPAGVSRTDQVLEEYTLVGHGIRTVSFVSIQVYVVALYVATSSLPALQQQLLGAIDIPSSATTATLPEREALKSKLLSDPGSVEFFSHLLDSKGLEGVKMALRIVPTRNTDYPHLRDGWVRGIQGKTQLHPELYDDDVFVESISRFKALFGGRKGVPKGRALIMARDENGALFAYGPDDAVKTKDVKMLSEGARKEKAMDGLKLLGVADDPRISRALWLCYFAGKKVASEGARKSVIDGLVEVVSRPVGSTEGKVV